MFEWDEDKSQRNLAERGFDFAFAARIFEGDTIERTRAGTTVNAGWWRLGAWKTPR